MSHSFHARFSTTKLSLKQICSQLPDLLDRASLRYGGQLTRLQGEKGWPSIDITAAFPMSVPDLDQVFEVMKDWWGGSLYCISDSVAKRLGRGDWMEMSIQIFKAAGGKWTLNYVEKSAVFELRREDPDYATGLYQLQSGICKALAIDLSLYREEDYDVLPVPTLHEIEQQVEVTTSERYMDMSAVVSLKLMDIARAQQLVGPYADRIRAIVDGFLLFPLLGD